MYLSLLDDSKVSKDMKRREPGVLSDQEAHICPRREHNDLAPERWGSRLPGVS